MSKQVVILTPGRSGSSMLASILMRFGVFMGYRGRGPDAANTLGYWEDAEFAELNHDILHALPYPAPILWAGQPWIGKMEALIAQRNARHELWGFKDSHTALTVTVWDELLDNPYYLYITRRIEDVIESYVSAWELNRDGVRANYHIYTTCIEQFLTDKPHLALDYDTLLETRDVEQIRDFLGLNGVNLEQARAMIRPEMKRI